MLLSSKDLKLVEFQRYIRPGSLLGFLGKKKGFYFYHRLAIPPVYREEKARIPIGTLIHLLEKEDAYLAVKPEAWERLVAAYRGVHEKQEAHAAELKRVEDEVRKAHAAVEQARRDLETARKERVVPRGEYKQLQRALYERQKHHKRLQKHHKKLQKRAA